MKTASALALGALTLAAPLACLAAPVSVAAQNCAQALANRMHARLAAVHSQPTFAYPPLSVQNNQYILTAHDLRGAQSTPMVCTFGREGQVLSLHRVAPVVVAQWKDTAP